MNLQELRDKEITMDREHNAKLIVDHVEATILHMLQTNIEMEPEGDWAEIAQTKIYEMGSTRCWLQYVDANVRMFDGSDIWLVIDYDIEVEWDDDFPQIIDVGFSKIMCYWMDMEFNLTNSDAVEVILKNEIENW